MAHVHVLPGEQSNCTEGDRTSFLRLSLRLQQEEKRTKFLVVGKAPSSFILHIVHPTCECKVEYVESIGLFL